MRLEQVVSDLGEGSPGRCTSGAQSVRIERRWSRFPGSRRRLAVGAAGKRALIGRPQSLGQSRGSRKLRQVLLSVPARRTRASRVHPVWVIISVVLQRLKGGWSCRHPRWRHGYERRPPPFLSAFEVAGRQRRPPVWRTTRSARQARRPREPNSGGDTPDAFTKLPIREIKQDAPARGVEQGTSIQAGRTAVRALRLLPRIVAGFSDRWNRVIWA